VSDFVPLFGYAPNPAGTEAYLSTLERPTLAQAGPDLALDKTRDVFLGQYLLRCDPLWTRGRQLIGSCCGWGWALSVDILAATEICLRNEPESYGGRTLEASIYGFSRYEARGRTTPAGTSDGSYGGACAKAVTQFGTLHYGVDYRGTTFTKNSGTLERQWGNTGVPDELEPFAAEHKVNGAALVKNFSDAARAIQNGYPVAVASMAGFSLTLRDGGYLTPAGRWAHCMMWAGLRWKPWPALLCVNSWGDCYGGDVDKNLPPQFQRSAGWIRAETVDAMCAGEDSFALSGFAGFPPRKLESWTGGTL